jgi:xanthine dehydrogenase YagS FAD-binding subunit
LITAVELPALPLAAHSRYRKARERASYAFAIGSVAAALEVVEGVVRDVRIALGAVAPIPWRAHRAEQILQGRPATQQAFGEAADAELAQAQPLRDNSYKIPLVRNLIVRTLSELLEGS